MNANAFAQVTTIKTMKQVDELVNMGDGAAWHEKWRIKLTTLFHQVQFLTVTVCWINIKMFELLPNYDTFQCHGCSFLLLSVVYLVTEGTR